MQNRNKEVVKYPKVLMKKTQKFLEEQKSIFIYEVHMEHDVYSILHFEQVRQNNVIDISFSSFRIEMCHHIWLYFICPFLSEITISLYKFKLDFCLVNGKSLMRSSKVIQRKMNVFMFLKVYNDVQ